MKKTAIAVMLMLAASYTVELQAQTANDPVIMTVNGSPVLRSEFEYSYNKNNSEGVIDKKTVEEYVDLFINYKLKVAAAIDAHYDTLTSYKKEFAQYRDQQVMPMLVTDEDMEAEAHKIYDETVERIGPDGLIKTAHILLRADQQAPQSEWDAAKVRIDSIYTALKNGADFADLATRLSQDPGSARQGGELPFVQHGQLVKEYEDAAFALQPGEMSGVVKSAYGYHIILMKERKMLEPFEEHHDAILRFMEQRNIRDQIAQQKVDKMLADLEEKNGKGLIEENDEAPLDMCGRKEPERVFVITDERCGSSGDAFVEAMSFSPKVTVVGRPTSGITDYSNVNMVEFGDFKLTYPTSRDTRIDHGKGLGQKGVSVDVYIPWKPENIGKDVELEYALDQIEAAKV